MNGLLGLGVVAWLFLVVALLATSIKIDALGS